MGWEGGSSGPFSLLGLSPTLEHSPPPKKTRLRQTEPCDWWVGTPSAQPGGGWSGQHLAGLQPPILRAPLPPITGRARVGTHGSMQATLVIV